MIIYDLPGAEPELLTGLVRAVPQPANFILNQFLPDREHQDIEVAIDRVTRTNRAAKFRAYDAETPIGKRDTWTRDRVTLPPIGQKLVVGEYERLLLERLRSGGSNAAGIVSAIYDDQANNVRAIRARMELARGDVLTDGKFTLTDENGLTLEADFGIPNTHIVAPATLWSDHANADPLGDIETWAQVFTTDSGSPPGAFLTSRTVMAHLLQNEVVRQALGSVLGVPLSVSRGQLRTLLEDRGLPAIVEYDTLVDVDGVSTRPIPADRFIMLPANAEDLGQTAWGITAEGLELAAEGRITLREAPGVVGVTLREGDPVRVWSKATAVGMPVIRDPNSILIADVA